MRLLCALVTLLYLFHLSGCCCIPFETAEQKARRQEELETQLRRAAEQYEQENNDSGAPVPFGGSVSDTSPPDALIAP